MIEKNDRLTIDKLRETLRKIGIHSDATTLVNEYAQVIPEYELAYHVVAIFNVDEEIDGKHYYSLIYDAIEGLIYSPKHTHRLIRELKRKTLFHPMLRGAAARRIGRDTHLPYVFGQSIFLPLVNLVSEEDVNWINLAYVHDWDGSIEKKGRKVFITNENVRLTFKESSAHFADVIHDACAIARGIQRARYVEGVVCGDSSQQEPIRKSSLVYQYSRCRCKTCNLSYLDEFVVRDMLIESGFQALGMATKKELDQELGKEALEVIAKTQKELFYQLFHYKKATKEEREELKKFYQEYYHDLEFD